MMMMMMAIERIITEAGLSAEDCSQVYTTPAGAVRGGLSADNLDPSKKV